MAYLIGRESIKYTWVECEFSLTKNRMYGFAMGVEMRLLLMKKSKLACYEILFIFLEDNVLTSPKICPKYICKDSSYGTFDV